MDEDEERLWFQVGGVDGVNGAMILGDGDNVALHAVRRRDMPFIAETGGGDMTDHNNRRAWIARTRRNNLRFRITLLAATVLGFSLFAVVLTGIAIRHCFTKAAYKMEIYEVVDRGYISTQYIHLLNEALHLIRHKRESDLLRKIRKLNEAYTGLLENVREVMKSLTAEDENIESFEDD
uniref:Uncharacterized protein n=1 Tax=Lygus hesperus TaxID=30085 RepID=A0A0A9XNH5_LYGHE